MKFNHIFSKEEFVLMLNEAGLNEKPSLNFYSGFADTKRHY